MATDSGEKSGDTNVILERLQEGLQKFAAQFAQDLNDPRLKKTGNAPHQLIFHLEADGCPLTAILIPQPVPEEKSQKKLTPREEKVEKELLKGLTYEAIAKKLDIEVSTVASHVRNIYVKRDIHSRVVLLCRTLGLMN